MIRRLLLAIAISGCGGEKSPGADARDSGGDPLDAAVGFDAGCIPREEICNDVDDDCDGRIDADDDDLSRKLFSDRDNCRACGNRCDAPEVTEAECRAGNCVALACLAGFTDYNGRFDDGCESDCIVTGGGRELCDRTDNDCDGPIDEGFDLDTDVSNCGACERGCGQPAHAAARCADGECGVATCEAGWVDRDGAFDNGCEYRCTVRATEQTREFCNGLDDDCDGAVDEAADLAPADEDFCGQNGECGFECSDDADCGAGERCGGGHVCVQVEAPAERACEVDAECQAVHSGLACVTRVEVVDGEPVTTRRCVERQHAPVCDGAAGYRCVRSPAWQPGNEVGRCDGRDNDCDGRVDEDFVADLFVDGVGRSNPRRCAAGEGVCRQEGRIVCSADGADTVCAAEALPAPSPDDGDCNGRDDDCDGVLDEDFVDDVVRVGGTLVYAYEASRPGATAAIAGLDLAPDDDVQAFVEARACSRPGVLPWANVTWAEADAACRTAGARLCGRDEWTLACSGLNGNDFPYGEGYRGDACNGGAYDPDPAPEDQDRPLPTGSVASCEARGAFDLSGNLKEWTEDVIDGQRPLRGGGFESNVPAGLTCGQLGDLKPGELRAANIGFRCCRDP